MSNGDSPNRESPLPEENLTPTKWVVCPVCDGKKVIGGCSGTGANVTVWSATCYQCGGEGKIQAKVIQ